LAKYPAGVHPLCAARSRTTAARSPIDMTDLGGLCRCSARSSTASSANEAGAVPSPPPTPLVPHASPLTHRADRRGPAGESATHTQQGPAALALLAHVAQHAEAVALSAREHVARIGDLTGAALGQRPAGADARRKPSVAPAGPIGVAAAHAAHSRDEFVPVKARGGSTLQREPVKQVLRTVLPAQIRLCADGTREWAEYSSAFAGDPPCRPGSVHQRRASPARQRASNTEQRRAQLPTTPVVLAPKAAERGPLDTARRGNLKLDDCVGTKKDHAGMIICQPKSTIPRHSMDLRCQRF